MKLKLLKTNKLTNKMRIFTWTFWVFRGALFAYLSLKLFFQYRNRETSTTFQNLDDEFEKVLPGIVIFYRHDNEMTLSQMIEEPNQTDLVERVFIADYDTVVENITDMVWFFNSKKVCYAINSQKGKITYID